MNDEEFYDQQIAPELLRLCKLCEERRMSFICCVEFDPSEAKIGRTDYQAPNGQVSAAQLLIHWSARCHGNVDSLIMAIMTQAEKHGHSSAYLQILGCKNIKSGGNETEAITVIHK